MSIDTGVLLGERYEVLGRLDSGTLADIRIAHDHVLERKVAVKVSDPGLPLYTPDSFAREARLAASLEHPHLLPIYDYGFHAGLPFLVMRSYDRTLREHLREQQHVPLAEALRLFRQLGAAVDYLHEKGTVHGNLKPDNIVLDTQSSSESHSFISDFGVASLGPELVGTPAYQSPEQAAGRDVSAASDLFSLGTILFETLTGAPPIVGNAMQHIARLVIPQDGQYSVRRLRPELPVGVDLVVAGLTQLEPNDRYATASGAIEEFARAFYRGHREISGTVFISYARSDADYVQLLAQRLRSIGIPIWSDRDIPSGANWDRCVEAALRDATTMLVVMSPSAAESENVRDEWSYFLEQKRPVHPFVYKPCELPFRLRRRQQTMATGDFLSDVGRIVESLSKGSDHATV